VRKYLLTMTDGAGTELERHFGGALRIGPYGTAGIAVAGLDPLPPDTRSVPPADWGGERPERISRVTADLLWLTKPDGSWLTFAERKVLGAAADLLREARSRRPRGPG
jgi:hypothetical protein